MGSPSPTSTYAIWRPRTCCRCFWYGKAAEIMVLMVAAPPFFGGSRRASAPTCPPPECGQRGLPEAYQRATPGDTLLTGVRTRGGRQSAAVPWVCAHVRAAGRRPPREDSVPGASRRAGSASRLGATVPPGLLADTGPPPAPIAHSIRRPPESSPS